MTARDVVTDYIVPQIELQNQLNETDIKVDFDGNAKEVQARITYWVEGKMKQIQVAAWELPVVE